MSNPYGPPTPSSTQSKPHLQSPSTSTQLLSSQSSPTTLNGLSGYSRDSPESSETPAAGSWWGASAGDATTTNTQKATAFLAVQDNIVQTSSDGFISLMDSQSFTFESKPPSRQATSSTIDTLNDEEDLGLGNSKAKPKTDKEEGQKVNPAQENSTPAEKSVENPPGKRSNKQFSLHFIEFLW
jgi:hypothetical protein